LRLLVLASYDSFLNVGRIIGTEFERSGCSVDLALVKTGRKEQISERQVASIASGHDVAWLNISDACENGDLEKYDIVLCCLEGLSTRRLIHHAASLGNLRPLIVSAYPGLVLRDAYDGYAMRCGCDLVWLNCSRDLHRYREMCSAFGISRDNARLFGVASLLQASIRAPDADRGPVVFFEQPVIPRHYDERVFLARELVSMAFRFPDREFLIKLRARGDDVTLHRTWYPLEPLLQDATRGPRGWPQNLRVSADESAGNLLERASHCLTVCSTVAIEAMNVGIPTTIIGDFGASDEYGLNYFFGSGLIRTFSDIEFSSSGIPAEDWWKTNVADPVEHINGLITEVLSLASSPRIQISSDLLRTEMSVELRSHLLREHEPDYVLGRKYQRRRKVSAANNYFSKMMTAISRIVTKWIRP
jgi:hypothetical protein